MQLYKCLNVKGDHNEDLKAAVVTWLNSQAAKWYDEGIHKLVPRNKCHNVKGDYVNKEKKVCSTTCIFSFCFIIKEYLGMSKRSLLSGRPQYKI